MDYGFSEKRKSKKTDRRAKARYNWYKKGGAMRSSKKERRIKAWYKMAVKQVYFVYMRDSLIRGYNISLEKIKVLGVADVGNYRKPVEEAILRHFDFDKGISKDRQVL